MCDFKNNTVTSFKNIGVIARRKSRKEENRGIFGVSYRTITDMRKFKTSVIKLCLHY